MKKMRKLLALMSLVLIATFAANAAQNEPVKLCNDKITVEINDMAPNADGTLLKTCYDITVAPNAVEGCTSLILTPVVRGDKAKKVVEVIVINAPGENGMTDFVKKEVYKVCDPNAVRVFTMKQDETLVIPTTSAVPYEEWMDGAKFTLTTQKATKNPSCIKALCGTEDVCDVPYLKAPLVVDPLFVAGPMNIDLTNDAVRAIKTRLYYPVNVTKSVDSYLENADALALLNTLDQPNFDVTNILIEGWASPEATVAYNKNLSVKRANTLKDIISKKYNFPKEVYNVAGNGEYWDSVIDYVATTENPTVAAAREAIQNAIESNSDLDKREAAIKKIDAGMPYKEIFNECYPRSRFADCEVSYKMKQYNKADVEKIFKADPSQITADEYVAYLNDEMNPEFLAKAVELYPNDERINAIAAEQARKAGNIDEAIEYYKKAGDSAEAMNNLGCCYLLAGDADNAKVCLDKAKDLNVAESNANELRKVVLNNKYFPQGK
jgi:Outer membrane protein and related peptidoglycan-associated (lipo)proteins